jgi:cytoskeletal protein CcmA (bactofilin family)
MAAPTKDTVAIGINTIIGSGSKFVGDLNVSGFVRIDGDVDGNVSTGGRIFIGPAARVHGNVSASSAVIGGIVLGNVDAPEEVKVNATAVVVGDVATRHLEVAEGVLLHGHCIALTAADDYERTIRDRSGTIAIRTRAVAAKKTADHAGH